MTPRTHNGGGGTRGTRRNPRARLGGKDPRGDEPFPHSRRLPLPPSLFPAAARSSDINEQRVGVACIRRLLSKETSPPVTNVLQSGVLARLIELLDTSPDAKLQFEAAWAITNIASTDFTAEVVRAGAVPPLVKGMMSGDCNLREQSIWCCGNIAGDCPSFRDQLIDTPGFVDALLRNIQHPENPSLLRNAAFTLSNLCRGKPSPSLAAVRYILPALAHILASNDKEVVQDTAWALSYLTVVQSDSDEAIVDAVVQAGVTRRLVELMASEEVNIIMPALRTVGNLISGRDVHTQASLEAGALKFLSPLLCHAKPNVRREACWAISNVAAGTSAQIDLLMAQPGLMGNVLTQLQSGGWNIKKEAAWVISNIASTGNPAHVRTLVGMGIIEPLAEILKSGDTRLLCVVLDAVGAILDVGATLASAGGRAGAANSIADAFEEIGLLDSLERLQTMDNDDVYKKCVTIIEKHYGAEETNDEDVMPGGGGGAPGPFMALAAPATTAAAPAAATAMVAPFSFSMGGAAASAAPKAPVVAAFGSFTASATNTVSAAAPPPWAGSFMTPPASVGLFAACQPAAVTSFAAAPPAMGAMPPPAFAGGFSFA
jgi:importin subunit alpha-1